MYQEEMQEIKTENNSINLSLQWILESGIQSPEGGFFVWYDLENKKHSFVYSEITGYAITTLLFLDHVSHHDILLERASKAAEWINSCALHPCGGVKTRLYEDESQAPQMYSFRGENIFSFDSAMVLYGYINLYRISKIKAHLDTCIKIAEFLLKMQNHNGSFNPVYNASTKSVFKDSDKWSNQPGSFLAKASLGLCELSEVTGNAEYKNSAIKLCEYALSKQKPEGRFVTDDLAETTHLHPHCYTIEGLLYAGAQLKRNDFLESAKQATRWTLDYVGESGINELFDAKTSTFNNFQRTDILAQVLRLGIIFYPQDKKLEYLKNTLEGYQYLEENSAQRGGFLYSKSNKHVNSWCTMFALQALKLYQDRSLIGNKGRIEFFI